MIDELEKEVRSQTGTLLRSNEGLREEIKRLRLENKGLRDKVEQTRSQGKIELNSRRAALSLMEDAVTARGAAERAEGALREREEQFRRAIEDAPIPVIMQAEDGQVLQVSSTWTELTGYAREDIPTFDAWLHHAYGPSADRVRDYMRQLFSGEKRQIEIEFDLTTRSGEPRCWAFSASAPGRLQDGRRFIVGMALDITERQQAAQAMALSEERFRVALEAAGMASWDYDLPSGKVVWNDQHFRLLGLPVDGKVKDPEDFFKQVHPDDAALVREELRRAVHETGVYRADFRIIRKDGVMRWMSGFGRAMTQGGDQVDRMNGVMFDVTEEHEARESLAAAQERLRLLVDSALEHAIMGIDRERLVTSWNSGAEKVTGYPAAEMLGRSVDVIFTPEDQAAGLPEKEIQDALQHGRASDQRWHRRRDGSLFWASGSMMPMYSRLGGEIVGFVKIVRDETEMQQARGAVEKSRLDLIRALSETEQARAEAESASKAKDHFFAVLSHELRTPLTPVILASQILLRRDDLPLSFREALEMIRRNMEVESRLVDDLLDVTRIARGKMELLRSRTDFHQVIAHAVEISRPDIDAREQELTVELAAAEHHLDGDEQRLKQAVWNLLKNASKFTPEQGRIALRTRNEGDRLLVEITDSGIGIEPQVLDSIFDPFAQASGHITREFGGLGLGLAIAKASVAGHGGDLTVTSKGLGHGATFVISLPIR